ncbi:MAG: hypothetical protein FD153_1889 [Rhodospirillaceae bacterium]|nr:MAG: hypothetical protein FD153_1889 [Rhodospirillaceae bacterium]
MQPFTDTALGLVSPDWLNQLPSQILVGLHMVVDACERTPDDLSKLFTEHLLIGKHVSSGAGMARIDYHLHGDGFGRILVRNISLTGGQAGRLVQRLTEIETYRMMALLGFPVARQLMPGLTRIETEVAGIVAALAEDPSSQTARNQLARLTTLATAATHHAAATSYRFAASTAYHGIIRQRIVALRETRLPGLQTFAGFMDRRLTPAMVTCRAAADRPETLNRRLVLASDLLQTRVDTALEESNRDLLASMDRRTRLQLRLKSISGSAGCPTIDRGAGLDWGAAPAQGHRFGSGTAVKSFRLARTGTEHRGKREGSSCCHKGCAERSPFSCCKG